MDSCPESSTGVFMFKAEVPHFFKIILDDTIQDEKLGIPKRFVKRYGNDLLSPLILKIPSGAKWQVELVKCDGEIWLQKGWKEFVEYYSLAHGSFLVFEYDQRNCQFNVIIFDKSASEIDYPFSTINGHNEKANLETEFQEPKIQEPETTEFQELKIQEPENEASIEILDGFSPCQRTKKIKLENPNRQFQAKRVNGVNINFDSKNPFFISTMQPTYVYPAGYELTIPAGFGRKYFKKQGEIVTLNTVEGKAWSVRYPCVGCKNVRTRLTTGWRNFAQENHLQVGDVCVFELIDCTKTTFKVIIFREIKDANGSPSLGLGISKQLNRNQQ